LPLELQFFWLTPDLPSGTCIFFYPKMPTISSKDTKRERRFDFADKIKQDDIDKLPKQKLSFLLPLWKLFG
jgi:hypothetical protein